jgi:hypothetical protein
MLLIGASWCDPSCVEHFKDSLILHHAQTLNIAVAPL